MIKFTSLFVHAISHLPHEHIYKILYIIKACKIANIMHNIRTAKDFRSQNHLARNPCLRVPLPPRVRQDRTRYVSSDVRKQYFGFPTRSDTNRPVKLQKVARNLNFGNRKKRIRTFRVAKTQCADQIHYENLPMQ